MSIRRPKSESSSETTSLVAVALLAQSLLGGAVTIWLSFQVWGPSTAHVTHPRAWMLFAFFAVLAAPVVMSVIIRLLRPQATSASARPRLARRAEAAERVLVNASHELRTPLTAILGAAETLAEADVSSADRRTEAALIRRQGEHLLAILSNITDLAALDSKQMKLASCPFEVANVVFDTVGDLRESAEEKGLSLDVLVPGEIPEMITTDPARFRQVLDNLLRNAIAFTKRGGVRVTVKHRETKQAGSRLVIEVLDTGVGISDPSGLFKPFRQLDAGSTREVGGIGVGLSLSREMARLLGGDVWHDRARKQGSAFLFEVPTGDLTGIKRILPVEPRRTTIRDHDSERLPCSVLLAEDSVDNQVLITNHLIRAGVEVSVAENGRIAVERALGALRTGRPFDLVLMDMQMPELDGYAATGELRRRGITAPIVALTANAVVGERTRCLDAGCNDYLTKPIDRRTLVDAVARHTRHIRRPTEHPRDEVSGIAPLESITGSITSDLADDEEMIELVALFVAGLPAKLDRVEHALTDNDTLTVAGVAHQLKGSAGGYGFMPITVAAAALEDSARRRAPDVRSKFAELRSLCERARVRRAA